MLLVMFTTVSGHKHGRVCLPGHMFLLGFGFRLRTDFTSRRHTPTMMETLFDVLVKDGETRASLLRIVASLLRIVASLLRIVSSQICTRVKIIFDVC